MIFESNDSSRVVHTVKALTDELHVFSTLCPRFPVFTKFPYLVKDQKSSDNSENQADDRFDYVRVSHYIHPQGEDYEADDETQDFVHSLSLVELHGLLQPVCILVDLVKALNRYPLLLPLLIVKHADVLLRGVKVQPTKRLPVVVVKENPEV